MSKREDADLPRYPPDQIGKRVTPEQLAAAAAGPSTGESSEILSREGLYALEKLFVWLPGEPERADREERERSATATVALAMPVLKANVQAGQTVRVENRRRATLPRESALNRLLMEILRAKPAASEAEILQALRDSAGEVGSPIDSITEFSIVWDDDKGREHTSPLSGLADRLSRVRRALKTRRL